MQVEQGDGGIIVFLSFNFVGGWGGGGRGVVGKGGSWVPDTQKPASFSVHQDASFERSSIILNSYNFNI